MDISRLAKELESGDPAASALICSTDYVSELLRKAGSTSEADAGAALRMAQLYAQVQFERNSMVEVESLANELCALLRSRPVSSVAGVLLLELRTSMFWRVLEHQPIQKSTIEAMAGLVSSALGCEYESALLAERMLLQRALTEKVES